MLVPFSLLPPCCTLHPCLPGSQVLLKPDGGGAVKLPAKLLSLYSCLFDDLFQDMLQQEQDEGDSHDQQQQQQQQVPEVPVQDVKLESITAVCR